ncbi:hypothetical protein N7478_003570 [Penicillium angulare]|uniref:uncharacterized protein n=1 Tax=Penicillium angulare TaxID=116970 RepID=UPI002540E52E|nr:uncharacterized protein N7478_003570 [Penicillium angulare]KAJ5287884.1 hypothetical protein N7478_003570 [Penicillium angulare]
MDFASDEAVQAYNEYFRKDQYACRHVLLLKGMIHFLVNKFDIQIDPNALPTAVDEEAVSEKNIRVKIVNRLLEDFSEQFKDLDDPDPDTAEQLKELKKVQCMNVVDSHASNTAAIEPSLQPEQPEQSEYFSRSERSPESENLTQEKDMALEGDIGGFDTVTGVLLPIPLDLTSVDRTNVLTYLIQKYSTVDLCAKLEDILTDSLRRVSEDGLCSVEELQLIGGDTESTAAGVYLHILWSPKEPKHFWLYVGQAMDLARRIADHKNKIYRRGHPSLHYHNWDSREDMCSKFVILATIDMDTKGQTLPISEQCLLDLFEMWIACLFQTLSARNLDRYLCPSISRSSAGRHLNVVPPIWQRFQDENMPEIKEVFDRQSFKALLHSEDPDIRSWAQKARDSYNDLRDSLDPELRNYWAPAGFERQETEQH